MLDLNPAQRAAVEHPSGPLLVIAGAGTGKTRVLTARVARLIAEGTRPEAILAFTFTNRAARQMRERILGAVGEAAERVWIGTFHATGVRVLRREARRDGGPGPGFPADFAIYDREDQEQVIAEVIKRLELPQGSYRVAELLERISDAKNALQTPAQIAALAHTPYERNIAQAYLEYQRALRRLGALDFDDLIAEVVRLFQEEPATHARYARRFEHVLVDEYQDTNHAQFRLVHALATGHGNLFVVGDDDQSIYGWRGADLANLLEFETAFPGAGVIRLEQNYRSTTSILEAANAVIANNQGRKRKTLWSERGEGARLRFVLAADEIDEARTIRAALQARRARGGRLDECAVLYRTNAQSRALETELRQHGIRYEIVGGVSFYQRREVKDVLAYLRLAILPDDAVAFWRVWNTPRRGLGDALRSRIEQVLAAGAAPNPLEALRGLAHGELLQRGAREGAASFLDLIDELRRRAGDPVDLLLQRVLERSGYLAWLDQLPAEEAADRRANVQELLVAAAEFARTGVEFSLVPFLAEAALMTDLDRVDDGVTERVLLLTAHNAKGLEFETVIIAGLEEGLFPHGSSFADARELEEERRLFYVALTRARDDVLLTAAAYRRRFDGTWGGQISRFVDEIPPGLVQRGETSSLGSRLVRDAEVDAGRAAFRRAAAGARRKESEAALSGPAYRTSGPLARTVGREVYHDTFGRGVVVAAEAEGRELRFTVRFGTQLKKVLGRFLSGGLDVD